MILTVFRPLHYENHVEHDENRVACDAIRVLREGGNLLWAVLYIFQC